MLLVLFDGMSYVLGRINLSFISCCEEMLFKEKNISIFRASGFIIRISTLLDKISHKISRKTTIAV